MKNILTSLLLLFSITVVAQSEIPTASITQKPDPLVLKGQIRNCPANVLIVFIQNTPGVYTNDTIHLNDDGTFHLATHRVLNPQLAAIQGTGFSLMPISLAPGFNMTLTCDGKNPTSTHRTLQIEGIGKESNAHLVHYDLSYDYAHKHLYEAKKSEFLRFVNRAEFLRDSIYKAHFIDKHSKEPYFDFFSAAIKLEHRFNKLLKLIPYTIVQGYSAKETRRFVNKNFDDKILDSFSNDEWLISPTYRHLATGYYLKYRLIVESIGQQANNDAEDLIEDMISRLYSGQTEEYAYLTHIKNSYFYSMDQSDLNAKLKKYEPLIQKFQNHSYVKYLENLYNDKESELAFSLAGKPAPNFNLPDSMGKMHSLTDFRGKVVLIDLWASWCGPCRKEAPLLKEIYKELKRDDLVFIGIAIRDTEENWKEALKKDQTSWLQLNDVNNEFSKSYSANVLPRYIIINKDGNFSDSSAPRPSDREKLIRAVKKELDSN